MDARAKPTHDAESVASACTPHRFNCQRANAPPPVFFGRPRAGPRLSPHHAPPRGAERRQTRGFCETPDGWPAKPSGGTLCEGAPSLREKRGASRRSTCGVISMCGPRFRERGPATPVSQLLAAGRNACERSPAIARESGVRCSRPAAPHQPTAGFPRLADPVSLDQISGPPSPLLRLHGVPCRRPSKSRTGDYIHIELGPVNSPVPRMYAR